MSYRPRRDIDDLDESLFDRDEAERRRRERAEERERAIERGKQLDAQDAQLRRRSIDSMTGTSQRMILAGYAAAGISPPHRSPLVSLELLRSMGWRIEELPDGAKTLVAPPAPEPYDGPRDRDSLRPGTCSTGSKDFF